MTKTPKLDATFPPLPSRTLDVLLLSVAVRRIFHGWLDNCFATRRGEPWKLVEPINKLSRGAQETGLELLRAAVAEGWITMCEKEDRGSSFASMRRAGYAVSPEMCHVFEPVLTCEAACAFLAAGAEPQPGGMGE